MSARTHPASIRRLQRARDAGDYPRSHLMKRGLISAAALLIVPSALASLWAYGKAHLRQAIQLARAESVDPLPAIAHELNYVFRFSVPMLALVFATSLAAHALENRAVSFTGARRMHFTPSFFGRLTLAQSVPWLGCAALVAYGCSWSRKHAVDVAAVLGRTTAARDLAAASALHLAWVACVGWLALGALELALSRRAWLRRHTMTRSEKQQEQRELAGDPWLAASRRDLHHDLLTPPAMAALHDTSLVIHASYSTAVLLSYHPSLDRAPRIAAVASGKLSRAVIEQALSADIPVREEVTLARELAQCRHGSEVPESAYERVAELIGHLPTPSGGRLLDAVSTARRL